MSDFNICIMAVLFGKFIVKKIKQNKTIQQYKINRNKKYKKMQQPQWKGLTSQKFSPGKKHLTVQNQLNSSLQPKGYSRPQGLRTFNHFPTPQAQFTPNLKIYQDKYISDRKQIDLRGKKSLVLPEQMERKRPELRHVRGGEETVIEVAMRGIRTFENNGGVESIDEYKIENKLQRKARILGLQKARNQIDIASLGDKAYKYSQYAPDFFKSGGLIPGSTITYHSHKQQFTIDDKRLHSVFNKPHWHVKVKLQQKQQQKKVVDSVDEWEQTILKENNPKYQDPDTFFERLEAMQGAQGGKDAKKGAKK